MLSYLEDYYVYIFSFGFFIMIAMGYVNQIFDFTSNILKILRREPKEKIADQHWLDEICQRKNWDRSNFRWVDYDAVENLIRGQKAEFEVFIYHENFHLYTIKRPTHPKDQILLVRCGLALR